jgi:hypothetical protein
VKGGKVVQFVKWTLRSGSHPLLFSNISTIEGNIKKADMGKELPPLITRRTAPIQKKTQQAKDLVWRRLSL